MKNEDMMAFDEQILWEGGKSGGSTFWEAIFNPLLPFAAIWAVVDFGIIGTAGVSGMLFSGMGFFFLFHLMPVWLYLGGILTAKSRAKNTRYAVTNRGIYIQTGKEGREQVKFRRLDEIRFARTKQGMFDSKYHVGDVVCEYITPIVKGYGKNRSVERDITLDNTTDYVNVTQLINYQLQMQHPVGPPMPVQQSPLTERRIPQQMQQPVQQPAAYPVRSDYPAGTVQPPEVLDPQQAFFGQPQSMPLPNEKSAAFLNPEYAEQTEFLEQVPDETVSELQHELFGSEAVQTNAFADPTVNPLPVLQSPQQGYANAPASNPYAAPQQGYANAPASNPYAVPQQGYANTTASNPYAVPQQGYANAPASNPYAVPQAPADPYARQPQNSVWGAPQEPEMESLFTEPPFEDPTLRALEELNPQEPQEQNDSFLQSGM